MEGATSTNTKIKYSSLLSEKQFIKLSLAKWISRFGDAVDTIAFSWMVYQLTGSSALIAVLFGVNSIPNIIFGLVGGTTASYFPKKFMVCICDIGRGVSTLIVSIMFFTGTLRPWHLFVFTFANSSFEAFRTPAASMLTKLSIDGKKMDCGISLDSSVSNIIDLIGLGTAGVILATLGISGSILLDSITFFICGLIIISLKVNNDKLTKEKFNMTNCKTDFKEGFKYFAKHKIIFNISMLGAVLMLLFVPFNSLMSPFVIEILNKGPEGISVIGIALTIGTATGSMLYGFLKNKFKNKVIFIFGGVFIGIGYVSMAFMGQISNTILLFVVLAILSFMLGVGVAFFNIPITVTLIKDVENEYLPRVISIFNTMVLCATPLGAMISSGLVTLMPINVLFLICGACVLILILIQSFNKCLNSW